MPGARIPHCHGGGQRAGRLVAPRYRPGALRKGTPVKANVDPLAASDSSPGPEIKAESTLSFALQLGSVPKLESAANEAKHIERQSSPPATSDTPASSMGAQKATPGGLTSDEARRLLAESGPNAIPDTSMHPLRMAL